MIQSRIRQLLKKLERSYDVYNRIEISRSALLHNLDFFEKKSGMQIIPVLKGNAYGHGIKQITIGLQERKLPYIAVDGYFEACKIRQYTNQPVLVMGMVKPQNFSKLRFHGFTFVVQDEQTLYALGALNRKIKVHLELNTGMNRYGIESGEIENYINLLKQYPKLELEGILTHLADPDGKDNKTIVAAVNLFDESIDIVLQSGLNPTMFHVGQSASSLRIASRHANAMRVGIGLYGINPFPAGHPLYDTFSELKPVMQLISTISKINELQLGDKVSYNYTFIAPEAMRIGVLPLGYYEGINRVLSNVGVVKIGSHFQPIVGRVCMNHTMINLDGSDAKAGDEVIVYSNKSSDRNSIDIIAAEHDLFPYTQLTGLSPDVRRYLV